ncbi:MAG: N-acetylglucosamine-1-phosphate uridyltransferase-like protein [Parcubacteria group bacterium Athens0714_16]|nr:MAG: N-acetylglucosamine-1-phosphate uridyltransferase-like protein [Parcubacteria group bacterium Athens0714_16]
MKAYIIKNKIKIEPFSEDSGELLIGNKRLKDLQKESLESLGIITVFFDSNSKINDDNEYLIFDEGIYFSPSLLREFIDKSKETNSPTVCSLKPGIFTKQTIVNTQNVKQHENRVEYNIFYYPEKNFRNQEIKPIILDIDNEQESLNLPEHMYKQSSYPIPLTEKVIVQVDHWANLWTANLMSILSRLASLKKISKFKLIALILKNHSLNKWKILGSLNNFGKNCDIHHTACIEGSLIGNNVTIGAGAVIRNSTIGDGCLIGNGVIIETSVIGEKSSILNGHIIFCVIYPGFFTITQAVSTSVIGRDCFIGLGAVLTDFRLDNKSISVIKDGVKIDTGSTLLGCCLGNNVYLGSGCIVAPGRIISNGTHISLSEEKVITGISDKKEINGFRII